MSEHDKIHEIQDDRIARLEDNYSGMMQRLASLEGKLIGASAAGGAVAALISKLLGGG